MHKQTKATSIPAATKQAGWTLTTPDYLCVIWSAWCARYTEGNGNDIAENHKNWQSIRNSEVGWPYLLRRVPQLIAEQYALARDQEAEIAKKLEEKGVTISTLSDLPAMQALEQPVMDAWIARDPLIQTFVDAVRAAN